MNIACDVITVQEVMNYYQREFHKLLINKTLDAILVYSNEYNDRFMKALTGTFAVLQNYILITKNEIDVSLPCYLVTNFHKKSAVKTLSADGEATVILPILKKLGKKKEIGMVGDCKYNDILLLQPAKTINLTKEANNLIRYKPDSYIKQIQKKSQLLAKIMDTLTITKNSNQLDLAKQIQLKVIKNSCQLAFPICITSGRDLQQSTSVLASNKKIKLQDIICIDMGLKKDIYTTDRTRMYFLNHPQAQRVYLKIKTIHSAIINEVISSKTTFPEIINEYRKRIKGISKIKEVLDCDFGHGIGFGLHEQPILEKTTKKMGKNIIFTLEPTFVTQFGRMRIEDMIGILSNGKVIDLTGN